MENTNTLPKTEEAKKYLVAWCIEKPYIGRHFGNKKVSEKDHYQPFIDGDDNLKDAKEFYDKLVQKEFTKSANICLIIESTDY